MKKLLFSLFSFFSLFAISVAQERLDVMNLPALELYVTDFTHTLSTDELNQLEAVAEEYDNRSTRQIVTVIIPDRQGYEMFDIGMKIFSQNKIGNRSNEGMLLLISREENKGTKPENVKIRIIVGYGLEDEIPDLQASHLIEDTIRPLANRGQFFDAILAFYEESIKMIDGDGGILAFANQEKYAELLNIMIQIILVVIILIFLIRNPWGGPRGRRKRRSWSSFVKDISSLSSGGSSGSSGGSSHSGGGFSGGGFSGGGGRSGGGGAGD